MNKNIKEYPTILVAILAKQKEKTLPLYLETLKKWDYPKKSIHLYIRSNDNTDNTEEILKLWAEENRTEYLSITEDYSSVDPEIAKYDIHEWNPARFSVLGKIRQDSFDVAKSVDADFYFIADVDNYLLPHALSALVRYNLPAVAPMLEYAVTEPETRFRNYSNFHHIIDEDGYMIENKLYFDILYRHIRGLILCPVIHCTYLIRKDVFPYVSYADETNRYEYVIFSHGLRKAHVPQFLDNSMRYGCLTLTENADGCRMWMKNCRGWP